MTQVAVLMRDLVSREATREIPVASVSNSERYIEPTEKTIEAMMTSFKQLGQLSPIIVHAVTRNSYRIVAGQTRFKAASRLGWKTIRAEIIAAQAIDYKIIELAENVDRRDLSAAQRRECRGMLRQMLRERFNAVAAAKGGRSHKGGVREVARQVGVPQTTARRMAVNKLSQNTENGSVSPTGDKSDPPRGDVASAVKSALAVIKPAQPRVEPPRTKTSEMMAASPLSVKVTVGERSRIERFNKEQCGDGSLSDCIRRLVREGLQKYGYWHEPGNGIDADVRQNAGGGGSAAA